MKKSLASWSIPCALIGLIGLSASCSKSPLTPQSSLPPVGTASYPEVPSSLQPGQTSNGSAEEIVFDQTIYGATTSVEVTEWSAISTYGEHNTVGLAVPGGYVMVGGGAHILDPNGNQANVDALLTAAYPVGDGQFTTYYASDKDQFTQYFSEVQAYVIGIKLFGPGGTVIPTSAVIPHLYLTSVTSQVADYPSISLSIPSQYYNRILSAGAMDDYGTGYGNLITESDWTGTGTTASGKDQHSPDKCDIINNVIAIDNSPIAGFGTLNVINASQSTNNVNHLQTISVAAPSGWALTGVGGHTTWSGYGRMLYDMYAPFYDQAIVGSKDQQTPDVSGVTTVELSAIQPAQ